MREIEIQYVKGGDFFTLVYRMSEPSMNLYKLSSYRNGCMLVSEEISALYSEASIKDSIMKIFDSKKCTDIGIFKIK